jgi:hypothetical protein
VASAVLVEPGSSPIRSSWISRRRLLARLGSQGAGEPTFDVPDNGLQAGSGAGRSGLIPLEVEVRSTAKGVLLPPVARRRVRNPAQRSTASSPSRTTANAAPTSPRLAKLRSNSSLTRSKAGAANPDTATDGTDASVSHRGGDSSYTTGPARLDPPDRLGWDTFFRWVQNGYVAQARAGTRVHAQRLESFEIPARKWPVVPARGRASLTRLSLVMKGSSVRVRASAFCPICREFCRVRQPLLGGRDPPELLAGTKRVRRGPFLSW